MGSSNFFLTQRGPSELMQKDRHLLRIAGAHREDRRRGYFFVRGFEWVWLPKAEPMLYFLE